ncbi:MAG: C39 family peptidase [Candidatus Roizmanbacteria bacterium]|nr:MAG: C39 family peptidase [Candidatus Roizmanbacteria bacterium]
MSKKKSLVNDMSKIILILLIVLVSFSTTVRAQPDSESSKSNGAETIKEFLKIFFPKGEISTSNIPEDQLPNPSNPPNPSIYNKEKRNGFVFYCQGNTMWKSICNLGAAGCAPTSLSMILSTFGIGLSPPQVDLIFQQNGWRTCGDNASYLLNALSSSWFEGLGMHVGQNLAFNGILDLKQAKNYLDQGYLIIASSKDFPCASCSTPRRIDHAFTVDNVDIDSSSVSIRDPNNCSYADGNDEKPENIIKSVSAFTWFYAFPIKKI